MIPPLFGKQEVGIWRVQKTLPTILHTYMKLVTKYRISAINSCWEQCDEKYHGTDEKTDRQTEGRTEVKQYAPLRWSWGINISVYPFLYTYTPESVIKQCYISSGMYGDLRFPKVHCKWWNINEKLAPHGIMWNTPSTDFRTYTRSKACIWQLLVTQLL